MKYSRSEQQKDRTQGIIEKAYNPHLGHKVRFNRDGVGRPLSEVVIVRTSYDREIEGLKIWYRDGESAFMKYFWCDQMKECVTCQEAEK
jgi:hypothetical protein